MRIVLLTGIIMLCSFRFAATFKKSDLGHCSLNVPTSFSMVLHESGKVNIGELTDGSLHLAFKSGEPVTQHTECNPDEKLKEVNGYANAQWFKMMHNIPELNKVEIETVNGNIAEIITPVYDYPGMINFFVADCATGRWLSVRCKVKTEEEYQTVRRIVASAEFSNN